jgi:putative nucleotidyltransferase with HDIG domain
MRSRARHTVGFFVDWLDDSYQQTVLDGILKAAEHEDVNVFCFEGGTIESPFYYDSNRNFLYNLARERKLDGLIILSATIGHYTDAHAIEEFCKSFLPLPVVSIASQIKGIPSVVVDNASGLKAIVTHLIHTHNKKRIAFIGGPRHNEDAGERLEVFRGTLAENGLAPDPDLIREGAFTKESGHRAVKELIASGMEFDAVVSANDDMALGALDALREAGREVPQSVSVTGFDNIDAAQNSSPPLATIDQPIWEQGRIALRLLVQSIERKKVAQLTTLPTEIVLRQSCGCFSGTVTDVAMARDADGMKAESALSFVLARALKSHDEAVVSELSSQANTLFAGLRQSLSKEGDTSLLLMWDGFAQSLEKNGASVHAAETVLSHLRKMYFRNLADNSGAHLRAEDVFHKIRILIAERYLNAEKLKFRRSADEYRALNYIREHALANPDEKAFYENFAANLPNLAIKRMYVARFHDLNRPDRSLSQLVFSYDRSGAKYWGKDGPVFPSADFLPSGTMQEAERFSVVVEAIVHQVNFGFIVIDIDPSMVKQCGEMRRVVSSYLQGLDLFRQTKEAENLTKNLADLRKLMGGVIKTLTVTVETRDPYTAGHENRVSDLARSIATKLGLPRDTIEAIRMSALVHDLGKIYVPAEILNKPGKLRDAELNLIRMHSEIGYEILRTIEFPWPIADIVHQHHERIDGSGYPKGLRDGDIQLEARIIAVADVVEAMASHRPYRVALGIEKAIEEIKKYRGKTYDAEVVDACVALFDEGFTFREPLNTA